MQELETYLEQTETGLEIKQSTIARLQELQTAKNNIDKELKDITTSIKKELAKVCEDTTKLNGYNFIVKGGFYDLEFDFQRFKEENPTLYIKYLKPHFSEIQHQLTSTERNKKNV